MRTRCNLMRIKPAPGVHEAFTLAEMAVAVALLSILFVALYGGMSFGFATTKASRENLRATQIMLERAEGLRLYNWNQLVYSNWIPTTFTDRYYPLTNAGESAGIVYSGTMLVTENPPLPSTSYANDMRAVIVTVNWTSSGIPRTRTLTTFVARNGMQNYIFNN
jgi:prepilin-type N-terminal cleavage/methylation domain-containing protein